MLKRELKNLCIIIPLTVLLILCVVPFIIVISSSLSTEQSVAKYGCSIWPYEFTLDTYRYLIKNPSQIINAYKVTILVSAIGTVMSILMQCGIAYPISRKDFCWRKPLNFFVYFTMMFSGGIVPSYILISRYLCLKDTIWALILPLLCSGWNIFLLRTYFQSFPFSLIEAAKIDGASEFYIFFKIVIPIVKTGIATVTLFVLIGYWNEWYMSMLYITKDEIVSLQFLLYRMLSDANFLSKSTVIVGASTTGSITPIPLQMATCVLAAGPIVVAFPFFQKYFVKGIVMGAVKE